MGSLTSLSDSSALVVIDTSVAINLYATGCSSEILNALPNQLLAVEAVLSELDEGSRRGRRDPAWLQKLVSNRLIGIVSLGDLGLQHFEELVVGSASDTLDDGEAATIAYAVEKSAIALIDERKAIRICAERFPNLRLGSTVDLFTHPNVQQELGKNKLTTALVNALQNSRMRVLPHHIDWVIGMIGEDQAALCSSLPKSSRT